MELLMGYDDVGKVYKVYIFNERKIQLSRDVVFDESKVGYYHLKKPLLVEEEIMTMSRPIFEEGNRDKDVRQFLQEQLMDVAPEHETRNHMS